MLQICKNCPSKQVEKLNESESRAKNAFQFMTERSELLEALKKLPKIYKVRKKQKEQNYNFQTSRTANL